MLALMLGSVLAVLGLAYVLWPLLGAGGAVRGVELAPELPAEASALEALREIEFDEATGKLSPEDYATLKATYTPMALAELRARETDAAPSPDERAVEDAAERLIARAKQRGATCPTCGPRPEPDALHCSDCGRFLGAACMRCGAPVGDDTARFCVECGEALAA